MLPIAATDNWQKTFLGATIGLLEVSGVDNSIASPRLETQKRETVARLRTRYHIYSRKDLLTLPVMAAYNTYYKRFKKTYHLQLQLESIVFRSRDLPAATPLVDANFSAEVETLVLTAAHDVAKLQGPVVIDVSQEGDRMTLMQGTSKDIYPGDMIMKDTGGICCSIIYGQDNRSPISSLTSHALYVAYAPEGVPVAMVEQQLQTIFANVRIFEPTVHLEQLGLLRADSAK